MDRREEAAARRGLTAIDGALGLIVFLLVVQMWLLTATLETFLAGHREAPLPAALVSAALFIAAAALALFVRRVDREARGPAKGRDHHLREDQSS
jgi:hypothetical protein